MTQETTSIRPDDAIVRRFVAATLAWGAVALAAGIWCGLQLAAPGLGIAPHFTFGRLRPLQVHALVFAFAGNAMFAGVYYSAQRLLGARPAAWLARLHFIGWQAIAVAAVIAFPLGGSRGRFAAAPEWPLALATLIVWLAYAASFCSMVRARRAPRLAIALWFYLASIVATAILQIVDNLAVPVGPFKSYSLWAGVHDALLQAWYAQGVVAFVLLVPFLGMVYYFLPLAAGRPIYSRRLAIAQLWSVVILAMPAAPRLLHFTAVPGWASTLGMVLGVVLWMPWWAGMVNGFAALRGASQRVKEDPVLRFFAVALACYGIATFESMLLSLSSVDALLRDTAWNPGSVDGLVLGWAGLATFGMIYWLAPRLYGRPLHSRRLVTAHFWLATAGVALYLVATWASGIAQGLMRHLSDERGRLAYPDFLVTVRRVLPMTWLSVLGELLYLAGMGLCAWNVVQTWRKRPAGDEASELAIPDTGPRAARGWPARLAALIALAVIATSLAELVPLLTANGPRLATARPYTPLELYGRDVYIREGCNACHSQMLGGLDADTVRYGEAGAPAEPSQPGELVYDHPSLWGMERLGPDLAREAGKRDALWLLRHFESPRAMSPGSVMPAYPQLAVDDIRWDVIHRRVETMARLGVPYDARSLGDAADLARSQAARIAAQLRAAGGPAGLDGKEVIALIAYVQRLGRDLQQARLAADPAYPATSAISACAPDGGSDANAHLRAWLDGAELPAEPTAPAPPVDAALRARGARLFATHCAGCHGARGAGDGPISPQLVHAPANFTKGIYELRTTDHEELPADIDLFRTISRGVHGTAMPPWGVVLSERDRWALVAQLETLSKDFSEDTAPPPIAAVPPPVTPERVAHGKQLYSSAGCASCHGADGRGDGPAADALRYASGAPAHPRDFAADRFHRGTHLSDIYLTIASGLDGTPMASFAKVLSPDDLWDVAMYVHSLTPPVHDVAGLRCPQSPLALNPDELIGVRTLEQSLANPE